MEVLSGFTAFIIATSFTSAVKSRPKKMYYMCCLFFFQAEDGIRDLTVTGVQTCALPISEARAGPRGRRASLRGGAHRGDGRSLRSRAGGALPAVAPAAGRRGESPAARRAPPHHVQSRAVRGLQRQPDPRGAAAPRRARPRGHPEIGRAHV